MAHFALVNSDNIVENVIVIPNEEEHRSQEFIREIGLEGNWIQTSITNRIRKVFAQPGFSYLPELDAFKAPKPAEFPSFVFNEESWAWEPPVPMPGDEGHYLWDEETLAWVNITAPSEVSWEDMVPPSTPPRKGNTYLWSNGTWEEVPIQVPEGWALDDEGRLVPPTTPPNTGTVHFWDSELKDWVDTGNPLPTGLPGSAGKEQ